jgi:hypothetical protein
VGITDVKRFLLYINKVIAKGQSILYYEAIKDSFRIFYSI